jgi:hypothetical protein
MPVELPDAPDAPVKIAFTVNPQNYRELWLTINDRSLYHKTDITNSGGDWGTPKSLSEIQTAQAITAMGTDGRSIVIATGRELWLRKEKSGTFTSIQPATLVAGEITSIDPYPPNLYYVLVDQEGVFILNTDDMFMGQGSNWKNLDVKALTVSNANIIISNGQGIQCLKSFIPFKFSEWSITRTPYCQ